MSDLTDALRGLGNLAKAHPSAVAFAWLPGGAQRIRDAIEVEQAWAALWGDPACRAP